MVDQPHLDSYSIAARVCLTVALLGVATLAVVAVNAWYFLH